MKSINPDEQVRIGSGVRKGDAVLSGYRYNLSDEVVPKRNFTAF